MRRGDMSFKPVRDHHIHHCIIAEITRLEPVPALGYHCSSENQTQNIRHCCDTNWDRRGCSHFNRGLSKTHEKRGSPHYLGEGKLDLPDYRGQGDRCRGTSGHHTGVDRRWGGEDIGFALPPETLHLERRDHSCRSLERLPPESSVFKHGGTSGHKGRLGGCANSLTDWT